jgi:hypothetical protein
MREFEKQRVQPAQGPQNEDKQNDSCSTDCRSQKNVMPSMSLSRIPGNQHGCGEGPLNLEKEMGLGRGGG